jgi:hypothetical protein
MASKPPRGLLAAIEAGVHDDSVILSSLLQKCILLGKRSGSAELRDWASRELNGYRGHELPDYRKTRAAAFLVITNRAGYNPITQRLHDHNIPTWLSEQDSDLEEVPLAVGVGELEALVAKGETPVRLIPPWGSVLIDLYNEHGYLDGNSHARTIYWEVPLTSIQGVIMRIRTALTELIAELDEATPEGESLPTKTAADQALQLAIHGDNNQVNFSPQHASGGGSNSTTVTSGNDTAGETATFWQRLRKRGAVVAIATIVSAIVTIAALAVAVFTWIGWTPWGP